MINRLIDLYQIQRANPTSPAFLPVIYGEVSSIAISYSVGDVAKEDCAAQLGLRAQQAAVDATKSPERAVAEAFHANKVCFIFLHIICGIIAFSLEISFQTILHLHDNLNFTYYHPSSSAEWTSSPPTSSITSPSLNSTSYTGLCIFVASSSLS